MTRTSGTCLSLCTHYCTKHTNFYTIDRNSFWAVHYLGVSHTKAYIVYGTKVIIWRKLVVLEYPTTLHKFQDRLLFGFGDEDCYRVLPYMSMAANLVMWPWPFEGTLVPPTHGGPTYNLASFGPVDFEKIFENVGGRRTNINIYTNIHIIKDKFKMILISSRFRLI